MIVEWCFLIKLEIKLEIFCWDKLNSWLVGSLRREEVKWGLILLVFVVGGREIGGTEDVGGGGVEILRLEIGVGGILGFKVLEVVDNGIGVGGGVLIGVGGIFGIEVGGGGGGGVVVVIFLLLDMSWIFFIFLEVLEGVFSGGI